MKLYSTVCFGFLVVFFCQAEKPPVISDFCLRAKVIHLDRAERARMTDASKLQILKHNDKVKKCPKRSKPSQR